MRRSAISLKDLKPYNTNDDFEAELQALRYDETDAYSFNPVMNEIVKVPNRKSIINANTGEHIAFVGKKFNYVQPAEHIPATLEALKKGGVEYVPRNLHVVENGAMLIVVLDLPQYTLFRGGVEEQVAQFLYKFFYNAKGCDHGLFGILRSICTNGSIAFDAEMQYKLHHGQNIQRKAVEAIELYKSFDKIWATQQDKTSWLAERKGTKAQVARYIGDGENSLSTVFKGERWAKKLLERWQQENEPTNAWDIYNMETNLISHQLGSNYSTKLTYMAQLNREVSKWNQLLDLRKAA